MRALPYLGVLCLMQGALASDPAASFKTVTWTGWFSNRDCAVARAKAGIFTETNPDCSEQRIRKGEAAVFISEQAKAIYLVQGYASVIDDLGYHLEIRARVDEQAKTMQIESVKRLEWTALACARPRKKDTAK